ncbi:MAG TPA: Crp/Fnr family transcriptional regulator [Steroidobacteraceae bacterium]|nr:Crp/Fnr family transcriptional regulator [Steroidobacteraceae bacterium]
MQVQNRLLEQLPSKAFNIIRNECELVDLTTGDVLYEPGEHIREVYFPTQSVVSLVAKAAVNATLEVALVSDEGMIGIPLLLGADSKPFRVLVQKSGTAWRMKAETFKRMTDSQQALRDALNKYALLRLAQVAQNAICANAHQIEARLARRLLMMQDRSHSDRFSATQESLASMLGVRRSTVTVTAISFQQRKIIQYRRGTLTILDRKGLEALSCECYRAA